MARRMRWYGSSKHLFLYVFFVVLFTSLGCSGSGDHSVSLSGDSVAITTTYTASVPALSIRERAVIDQGQGEYVGVDDWAAHDPIAAGAKLVNGGTGNLLPGVGDFSQRSITAYSNYFATESALNDSIDPVSGLLNSALYNGRVQVGPWRLANTTGDFTYRRYGITYEVMRPMPVTSTVCSNNLQMDTGAPGGATQFYTPFIRQDLIRLGYVKLVGALDSTAESRKTAIPRYTALINNSTVTQAELNQLALNDYTSMMAQRTEAQQALAARLRAESIALRTAKSRSSDTFTAAATSTDLSVAAGVRIDGFASVNLSAPRNITVQGTIWGMDRLTSTAGSTCGVSTGGLIEAWTDRLVAGEQAISMSCGTVQIGGRVQSQAGSWTAWNQGVPGKIVLTSADANSAATGIAVGAQGQVLALLQTSQTDKSLNAVRMTTPGSAIEIDGLGYGFNVVADKGTVHIENTGATGAVRILNKAAMSADIVKAGAVGAQGELVVYGGSNLDANELIKLFGGTAGGKITFKGGGQVILTSGNTASPIVVSADTVEVETGTTLVTRYWNGSNRVDVPADVYCNRCYWSGADVSAGYQGTWSTAPTRQGPPPADRAF